MAKKKKKTAKKVAAARAAERTSPMSRDRTCCAPSAKRSTSPPRTANSPESATVSTRM